jgi:hypothetical protein
MKCEKEVIMNTKQIVSVIYNRPVQTKAESRTESEKALEAFLRAGGVIETVKSRKAPKSAMKGKNSRGFTTGTSGFATGYPKRSGGATL